MDCCCILSVWLEQPYSAIGQSAIFANKQKSALAAGLAALWICLEAPQCRSSPTTPSDYMLQTHEQMSDVQILALEEGHPDLTSVPSMIFSHSTKLNFPNELA